MDDARARNLEIIRLRRSGVGLREIARRLDLGPGLVSGVLHRAGLTKPDRGRGNGATAEFKRLAVNAIPGAKTIRQGCRDWGIDFSTFYLWRRELEAST